MKVRDPNKMYNKDTAHLGILLPDLSTLSPQDHGIKVTVVFCRDGASICLSDSEGVGCIEAWTTSDHDRLCSCACGVRTSVSRNVTFNSRAKIVLCIAECCACNELYNNSRCWCESVVRCSKSWLIMELGALSC